MRLLAAIEAAAPAVPVAVNVPGLPDNPLAVAVRVFGPAVGPSVHDVTAAIPFAPVVTGVVGVTVPPPEATANVTATPATALPLASRTTTEGFTGTAVPAAAVWPLPAFTASELAAPAVPVAVNVTGLPDKDPAVAVRVLVPAVGLSVQLPTVATPLAFVVWLPPVIVPFPGATANVTATPLTGFPFASFTITDGGVATAVPAVAVWPLPAFTAIELAAPAVPVAVNVTGLPDSPLAVAVREFGPAVGPRVHDVTAAIPFIPVLTAAVGVTVPPPDATANDTATPATGFPFTSFTMTEGSVATALPAVAVCPFPAFTAIEVAAPAVPVAAKVIGLPVSPLAVAVRLFGPAVGPSVHDVTVAIPFAPVVTGAVGTTVPPPEATANVTATAATGFPFPSFTMTEGGVATALPAVAVCPFPAFTAIELAAPAVPVAVNVTGLPVRDPAVAVRVLVPAVGLRVQLPTVATPLAFVV